MEPCLHTEQTSRENEKGLWCVSCGLKVYQVEERTCGECKHSSSNGMNQIRVCDTRKMLVTDGLKVTYRVSEETCWEEE